ncbi:hypothetical protein [Kordiimonas aestuarii]|uniref:hypothetical protein n=1 Tax=Kordiimonas aestuarii TaxID=1005925 RepID=UPI0021CF2310|nr:hypothetical protein [Kordiimonas aestuarii]
MQLLFTAQAGDMHASAVAYVLRLAGHDVSFWCTDDIPQKQTGSVYLGNDIAPVISCQSPDITTGSMENFDVVWHRRPSRPVMPSHMHPADVPVAEQEFGYFLAGLRNCLAPYARWVNPLRSYDISSDKLLQLKLAVGCGLNIPETLASHDPEAIRAFARRHESGGLIFKTFAPANWRLSDGGIAAVYTTLLSDDDLDDDYALRHAPGIYQPYVPKAYELRVTMFGRHDVSIKINSQNSTVGKIDWRGEANEALGFTLYELPAVVRDGCILLMEKLGIVFGCFDFIVTPDREYIFLEVNPMGNFLPIEDNCPESRMLETFCAFLIGGEGSAQYGMAGVPSFPSLKQNQDFQAWVEALKSRHIVAPYRVTMEAAE